MMKNLLNNDGTKADIATLFSMREDAEDFVFRFESEYTELYTPYSGYNKAIYKGDVVEVFLTLGGACSEYLEMELAPNGALYCAVINNAEKFSTQYISEGIISGVNDINDKVWNAEITLNKKEFARITTGNAPLYFNAYRIITNPETKKQELFALYPTRCATFHRPEFFEELKNAAL